MPSRRRDRPSIVDPRAPKPAQEEQVEDEIEKPDEELFEDEALFNDRPVEPVTKRPRRGGARE